MTVGAVLRSFAAPAGNTHDLAWDGHTLWAVDAVADLVYQLNPYTGAVLRSFAAPTGNTRGLAWGGHTLWAVDAATDLIYQISLN